MDKDEVNIPSTIQEANYRYRMPRMTLKIESKGNGVKTNITNLPEVAKALDVPPDCTYCFTQIFLSSSVSGKALFSTIKKMLPIRTIILSSMVPSPTKTLPRPSIALSRNMCAVPVFYYVTQNAHTLKWT
jgi:hypothetical protein